MKAYFLILCVLIAVATVRSDADDEVDSCYTCYSSTSWSDCYDQEYREDCRDECSSKGIICDKCYKYHDIRNNLYRKGCAQKDSCDNAWRDLCQSPECEIWCCDGDNCNGAEATGSRVSLGVLVMVGLAILVNYLL